MTAAVLTGQIDSPRGFEACIINAIGGARLAALRSRSSAVEGRENDFAATCLAALKVPPDSLAVSAQTPSGVPQPGAPPAAGHGQPGPSASITVEFVKSSYAAAPGGRHGSFKTGQPADIMLSGIDFNNSGGPLLFNHPSGIASDGQRLFLADTLNNRVLIWNTAPTGNMAPDLVLGQKDFTSNDAGTARDRLDWPVSLATDGRRLVVADTFNDRVLIWKALPTSSGIAADIVIQGGRSHQIAGPNASLVWPWGVWTDGQRLVVSATGGAAILIWNRFPERDDQPADIVLRGGGMIGTPRQITSDGRMLLVGDHNARVPGKPDSGAFVWTSFPTSDDQPFDFYMPLGFPWPRGTFTSDGQLVLLSAGSLGIWKTPPTDASGAPDPSLSTSPCAGAGDYESLTFVGKRLYVSCGNGNKVVGYDAIPAHRVQTPDFVIGSPDLQTNTLGTNYFVQNGSPASDGKSLFVSSDFDRKLYVWKNLPDQSGARPDIVYSFNDGGPWDIGLSGDTLALAGARSVYIWRSLPLDGRLPDQTFTGSIGGVRFSELKGVALDGRYFYLADAGADSVYVWEGLPTATSAPKIVLSIKSPRRLDSDGTYLAVTTTFDHTIQVYRISDLSPNARPARVGGPGRLNLPEAVTISHGQLFVADTPFSRVLVWRKIEEALSGKWPPDAVLGAPSIDARHAEIGRDRLFWPGGVAFDGNYLWVAEFKFGNRILRFSPSP
ncbi:MAG: hypothetical protein HY678_05875 [Chloroflexi bacterium]|nr:hypothetical protein [Chloroflexota bacterium]